VQFCWNSVTGMIAAPAFACVTLSFAMPAQCRFFPASQVDCAANIVMAGLDPAIHLHLQFGGCAGQARA
jgi:hypothetical protein